MSEQETVSFEQVYLNRKADEIRMLAQAVAASTSGPLFIAIDGRCAAGKTGIAEILSAKTGWPLVHLDDFFLRPEQRSPERYETPGENVDWERLIAEVITPLKEGREAVFRRFDCGKMAPGEELRVPAVSPVIFEGSYSLNEHLRPYFGLKVFMDVNPDEQLERILARSGPEKLAVFRERWIPLEEAYFGTCGVREAADLYINTSMTDEF
jgi:uridine kinase